MVQLIVLTFSLINPSTLTSNNVNLFDKYHNYGMILQAFENS